MTAQINLDAETEEMVQRIADETGAAREDVVARLRRDRCILVAIAAELGLSPATVSRTDLTGNDLSRHHSEAPVASAVSLKVVSR